MVKAESLIQPCQTTTIATEWAYILFQVGTAAMNKLSEYSRRRNISSFEVALNSKKTANVWTAKWAGGNYNLHNLYKLKSWEVIK